MKTKRFWLKVFVVFLLIAVPVCGVKLVADQIYENYSKHDEVTLLEIYEVKKEKCELLRAIPNDFIEEGKGINLQEIPDNITYEIENKSDGNIRFYYYIEPYSDSNPYKAWITLSKDYKVIEEEYGIELDDFETFKQNQVRMDWFGAYLCSIGSICVMGFTITAMAAIYYSIKTLIRKKSHSQEEEPIE